MSKSVLDVVNYGIQETKINSVNKVYEEILKDFYSGICVIDPKRGYIPSNALYSKIYTCFDRKRNSSTLYVDIESDNVIKTSHVDYGIEKNMTYKEEVKNSITRRYKIDRVGVLSLEQKSILDNEEYQKSLLLSSMGGIIVVYEKNSSTTHEEYNIFSYEKGNLSYIIDDKKYEDTEISFHDSIRKIYGIFKNKKPTR